MDVAVNLVESYLRLNGYLTLSEFELTRRTDGGVYETITDVDIVGLRIPGHIYAAGDPHGVPDEHEMLLIEDEVLELDPECVDVIIGEVKESEAVFNPAMKDHRVLHAVLRRLEWLYRRPLTEVIEELQRDEVSYADSQGGAQVRTRLVAFGQAERDGLNVISFTHVVQRILAFFEDFEEVVHPTHYKDPAPAMLRLLVKSGFSVRKMEPDRRRAVHPESPPRAGH